MTACPIPSCSLDQDGVRLVCQSAMSAPRSKPFMVDGVGQAAVGSEVHCPPRPCQRPHAPPVKPRRYKPELRPTVYSSMCPDAQEAAAGPEIQYPPSALCHRPLSVPTTKTSSRPGPQDATSAPDARTPPRLSHSCQPPVSHHLCHRALSVPRTKTP